MTKLSWKPYLAEDGEPEAAVLPCPYRIIVSTPRKNELLAVSAGMILYCVPASPYPTRDYGDYGLSQSEGTNAPINCTMSAKISRDVILHKVGKSNHLWLNMNRWG